MRRNAKFTFTKKEDRPTLSPDMVRYWKDILRKISKVGFEHEYNLSESRGTCTGDTFACPCSHPEREIRKCYTKCMSYENCKLRLKYECPGIYCFEFVSPCTTCKEAVRDCSRCPMFDNPEKKPERARTNIATSLKPSKDLSCPGPNGTFDVIKDGSLSGGGGVEVITVGRRVNYESFHDQATKIISECQRFGAYLDERTSIHTHLIGGYFDLSAQHNGKIEVIYNKRGFVGKRIREMEKPMPEIILANFHQLIRRYHNALTWITSAGAEENKLTRWVKFRKSILKYSALRTKMTRVIGQIAEDIEQDGKYAFVSYYNTTFDETGKVSKLHMEGRFADGMMSPTAVVATSLLLYCLLIKAVSLSQYGILHSGDVYYMDEAYAIQSTLLNNDGSYQGTRSSDTSRFAPYMETVRNQTEEMISLLHSELRLHGPALEVLHKLADTPCSMRLIRGDNWEKIEADLLDKGPHNSRAVDAIMQAVDTHYIDDCIDSNEWDRTFSEDSKIDVSLVSVASEYLMKTHSIVWDNVVGTYVRC